MQRSCLKIQVQFKRKTRSFLLAARKRKMISDQYFQMNVSWSMNKNTKLYKELQWLIREVAINLLTFIVNLITRPKILFTLLDQSIQMRLQKNVKYTMSPKTNGQRSKTWPSLVTTTQSPCTMVDTSTWLEEEIAWMRLPLNR